MKQRQVFEAVQKRIQAGDFLPGDQLPSDAQLVREFGVSRPTVAKAVRELERCGMVRRRQGAGTVVLPAADRAYRLGLLMPGLQGAEIFEPICAQIASTAQNNGHSLLWSAAQYQPRDNVVQWALEACRRFVKEQVTGVFFSPLYYVQNAHFVNQQLMDIFSRAKIPVVLLDGDYLPYPERSPNDLVAVDNRRVGYTITHHLFQQGCRRVVFLARPLSPCEARIAGFIEAVVKDAGSFHSKLVVRCEPEDTDAVAQMWSSLRPDGIVCDNDMTAGHLMHSLDRLSIAVPTDALVAGIDDVKYAALLRVPLTSIRQPCQALGDVAYRTLLDRIQAPQAPPREILLDCQLVVRDSTMRESLPRTKNTSSHS